MLTKRKMFDLITGLAAHWAVSDLSRGAYSGKETKLYNNSGTNALPVWDEVVRIRNVTFNDGPALADVEFHGAAFTSQIPGYKAFNGSLEYVRKRGVDATFTAIKTASENGDILEWLYLNDDISVDGALGWRSPVILGEFANTSNGGDPVVETIPFSMADAYDSSEAAVVKVPVTTTGGVPSAQGVFAVLAAQQMMALEKDAKARHQRAKDIMADLAAQGIQAANGSVLKTPPKDYTPKGLADLMAKAQKPG